MTLRVACELDGTLADLHGALRRETASLFGVTRSALTDRELRALWAHVARVDDFWMSLAESEAGGIARLAEYAGRNRWEVIFLADRLPTRGDTAQHQSQRWLAQHGFDLPSVYITSCTPAAAALALGLDVVVDDDQRRCLDTLTTSKASAVLLQRPSPEVNPSVATQHGLRLAASMEEALRHIEALGAGGKPGFLARLRNIFR